jgi:hypothetical protein
MRQGWNALGLAAALTASALVCASLVADAAPSKSSANGLHQFTGIVTSVDKSTLTVEKRGKNPRTVVFTRHAEMKTTGDVDKNAVVTVYYRDEGGKSIAHRVVAKPAKGHAGNPSS